MKHITAELEGALLDLAVAKAQGRPGKTKIEREGVLWVEILEGMGMGNFCKFMPSTIWDVGGPIIERERISLITVTVNWGSAPPAWIANVIGLPTPGATGRTMLEAGMRAFVRAKLGDEVDLP